MHVDLALSYWPRAIAVADLVEARLELVRALLGPRAPRAGIELQEVNPVATDFNQRVNEMTNYRGADDVVVAVGSKKAIESAQNLVGRGAILDLFGGLKKGEDVNGLDTGIIHYKETNVTGSSEDCPWDIA